MPLTKRRFEIVGDGSGVLGEMLPDRGGMTPAALTAYTPRLTACGVA
jgi:hypothetical protein